MAARLARDNRVLFVEPPASSGTRQAGPLGSPLGRPRAVAGDDVHVLTTPALPGRAGRALRTRLVRRAARALGLADVLLWGFVAEAEELVEPLAPAQVVFHCRHAGDDEALERRFARRADLVLAAAPALAARLRGHGVAVRYAPAPADTAAFARALADGPVDRALAALSRPRIVVAGTVTARTLDVALLVALARRRPAWQLALVGPVAIREAGALTPLRQTPSIHLLGARPHASMPEVLRGADAGLVPWRVAAETATMFPMRVSEYLAAGLPVAATPLPALDGLPDVHVAEGAEALADVLGRLLADDDLERRRARSAAAAARSWDARLEEIATALRAAA